MTDELTTVGAFVDQHWSGRYITRFEGTDIRGTTGRLYRSTLHGPDGPVVWTLVRPDGGLEDHTR